MQSKSGYLGIGPEEGNFVPKEDAYDYALQKVKESDELLHELYHSFFCGHEEESDEYNFAYVMYWLEKSGDEREEFEDWFYSGNWIYVSEGENDAQIPM